MFRALALPMSESINPIDKIKLSLAEELIVYGNISSILKHRLIAPSFASKYIQNSIFYIGAVLWNPIGRSEIERY